ncbi:MAG: hypothetical protein ACRC3H_22550 [Lachnospiraceae bacterium]
MNIIKKKTIGFYFTLAAGVVAIAALIYYLTWASANNSMDKWIIVLLVIGIIIDIVLVLFDNDYLVIASCALYSASVAKLLTSSVGSFVDAIQGINMFGDSSQVGIIMNISIVIAVSILFSIISAFLKRVKEA